MAFTPSGVEFVARNLRGYLSDLKQADQAQQAVGRSAAGIGGKFGQAQGQAQSFGRAVSGLGSNVAGLGSSLNSSLSSLSGFGSALSNVAQIAAGNLLASGISTFVGGVKEFISIGADAVGEAQKLEAGLGALLTQNNLYERQTKEVTVAVGNLGEMQAEAALKSEDLAFKQRELTADINRQNAAIQEQRQRIIQMADGLDKNEQVAKLEQMEIALEGMNRELVKTGQEQGKLTNITQEYTTTTQTSYEQINSFAEAQRLAAQQTQDLLGFVDKLSIISPFESDQVALVTKFAVGAGLAVDEAKAFTAGFLDLAAAVGIGSEELSFASDQLLQVAKIGQITTVDLRQLRRLGIDLEKIIGVQMGLSIDEFNEKAKQSPEIFQELFNGVAEFSAKTFPGAAAKLASSLGGISSTFSDIFRVGAKNLMRPFVDAVGPAVSGMLGRLSDVVTGPELAKIGASIPRILFGAMGSLSGEGEGELFSGLKGMGLSSSMAKDITEVTQSIGELFDAFQTGGFTGLAETLGISPEFITLAKNLSTSIGEIVPPIKDLFTTVASYGGFGLMGLLFVNTTPDEAAAGLTSFVDELERLAGVFNQGFETGGMSGGLSAIFGEIDFSTMAGKILAGIPDALNAVTEGIGTYFSENVPDFQEKLAEWGPKFWEWTNTAIEGVGAAMGAVLLAVGAWAMSEEGQNKMSEAGRGLGAGFFTGIGLVADNSEEYVKLMSKVAGGLLAGVAAIGGILLIVGSEIVAGIWSGLLESIGIDLQPATFSELSTILGNIGSDIKTIASHVGTKIVNGINDGLIAALRAGMKLGESIKEKIEDAKKAIDINEWMTLGGDLMAGLLEGITENSAQVLEFLKNLAYDSLASLKGIWLSSSPSRAFANEAKNAMDGLTLGANKNAPGVMAAFGGIGKSAINALMTGLTVQNTGFQDKFLDDLNMGGIAKAAGGGGSGWKEMRRIIHNTIRGNMHVLEGGGDEATIFGLIQREAARFNFPPGLAMEFAKAEGLVGHLKETFGTMWTQMRVENLKGSIGLVSQFAGIGQAFADMIKEETEAAAGFRTELNKLAGESDKLNKTQTDYQKKLVDLNADLLKLTQAEEQDAEAIRRKQEAIDELTLKITENQEAVEANTQAAQKQRKELELMAFDMFSSNDASIKSQTAMIDLLQEFLGGSQESLLIQADEMSQAAGITGILYDRVGAQQELNRLLEEQQRRQEEILAMEKAQKDMAFLQQQISLLDLIQSKGLNPADILGGITLGLGAKASDLLTVTNNIVQAMIDQINEDLQISSPSRVMAKIGQQTIAGIVQGIQQGQNLLSSAIEGVPLLNGSVAAPFTGPTLAGAGGGDSYSVTIPMGGVTINNGMDMQTFEDRVTRAVVKGMRQ